MNKAITKAYVTALAYGPLHSVVDAFRDKDASTANTFVCMAHPDDEILVASTLKRIHEQGRLTAAVYSDGSSNTGQDRLKELKDSYKILGLDWNPVCLTSEKEVWALANVSVDDSSREANLRRLVDQTTENISVLERMMKQSGAERVITTAFEGGHFLHDLTHLAVSRAAARLSVPVYEVAQYSLVARPGANLSEIEDVFKEGRGSLARLASYSLGIPLENKGGLTDPSIGIKEGVLRVTRGELRMKRAMKKVHVSQRRSLRRSASLITHAQFVKEYVVGTDSQRDLTVLPKAALPLYEFRSRRPSKVTFERFAEIVEEVDKKSKVEA